MKNQDKQPNDKGREQGRDLDDQGRGNDKQKHDNSVNKIDKNPSKDPRHDAGSYGGGK